MNLTRGQLWAGIIAFPSIATLIILYHHAFLAAVIYEAVIMVVGWVIVVVSRNETKREIEHPVKQQRLPFFGD